MSDPGGDVPVVRVLLVDDHPVFLTGLEMLVEQTPGLALVAVATTGEDAVGLVQEHAPDVVVMDIHLPGMSGVEATARIVACRPDSAVLVLSMFDQDEYLFPAIRAGARGYIVKGAGTSEIAQAIQAVAAGQATFGPGVANRVLAYFSDAESRPRPTAFPELTDREREVLALLGADLGNAVIARRLGIGVKTVRNYVSAITIKLQAADRLAAGQRAREAGLAWEPPG